MNNQIEATYDEQATYPDAPMQLKTAPKVHVKARPVYRSKKPVLTPTEYQATPKDSANLSQSLDHYLFW